MSVQLFDPSQLQQLQDGYRQHLTQRSAADAAYQASQAKPKGGRGGFLTSLISEGGAAGGALAGGAAGTMILPGVGTVIGAGLGGLIGGFGGSAAEQKVRDNKVNWGNAAKEGAISGVTSAILPGGGAGILGRKAVATAATKTAGKATGNIAANSTESIATKAPNIFAKFSKKLDTAAKDLNVKNMGLTKGDKNKIIEKTGSRAADIADKYGIKSASDVRGVTQPMYDEFSKSVGTIKRTFTPQDIQAAFAEKYSPMLKKGVPTGERAIGERLKAEADNLIQGVSKDGITASELNALRQKFDKLAYKLKVSDPNLSDVNKQSRDVLAKLVHDAADSEGIVTSQGTLKTLGKEISDVERLGKAAAKNIEGVGGHANPGVSDLLTLAAGGAMGGVPGALALETAKRSVNSARGVDATIKALKKGSSLLDKVGRPSAGSGSAGAAKNVGVQMFKVGTANNVADAIAPSDQSLSENMNTTNPMTNMSTNVPTAANMSELSAQTPENTSPDMTSAIDQAILQALAAGDTKGLSNLLSVADYYQKKQEADQSAAKSTSHSKASAQQYALAQAGLGSLSQLEAMLQNGVPSGAETPGQSLPMVGGTISKIAGVGDYNAQAHNVLDALARVRTGAAMTRQEEAFYKNLLPKVGDSQETIQAKLVNLKSAFSPFLEGGTDQYVMAQ